MYFIYFSPVNISYFRKFLGPVRDLKKVKEFSSWTPQTSGPWTRSWGLSRALTNESRTLGCCYSTGSRREPRTRCLTHLCIYYTSRASCLCSSLLRSIICSISLKSLVLWSAVALDFPQPFESSSPLSHHQGGKRGHIQWYVPVSLFPLPKSVT